MNHDLPLTLGFWVASLAPLVALLIMLVGFKWSAPKSGIISVVIAAVIAYFVYEAPLNTLLVASGKGLWDALSVLLIIWTAMLLYQVSDRANAFVAIREGMLEYSRNYLFLILGFGWVFASFLQGIAGFGSPIAVVAPLLIGIGVKPVIAVVIPLIGHTWANTFGSLGVAWLATEQIIAFDNPAQAALVTAIPLWILNFIAGIAITFIYGKMEGVKQGLPAVLVISLIHGGGQMLIAPFSPALANFIPTLVALVSLYFLSKWPRYNKAADIPTDILLEKNADEELDEVEENALSLKDAVMPYVVLTFIIVIGLGIPPIKNLLAQVQFGFDFPGTSTGYNYNMEATQPFSPISIFTQPGFYILMTSIFAYYWFKSKGRYNGTTFGDILKKFVREVKGSTISIMAFLVMANILEHSGQTAVLALGIASVSSPTMYASLSHWIGLTGSFMTGSNTASNILMSPLHSSVVADMGGLSISHVIAGQTSGGALGNAISPSNIVLGVTTAGIEEKNSEVLRYALVFAGITAVILSAIIPLLRLVFPALILPI